MNFFFLKESELTSDAGAIIRRDARLERLMCSMDLRAGAEFRVAVERRGRGTARVECLTSSELRVAFVTDNSLPGVVKINVMLALPRPKVIAKLIPRLVSMGISSLTIVNAAGVKKEYFSTHWLSPARIDELLVLGIEQSGVYMPPEISIQPKLRPYLEDELGAAADVELRMLCVPSEVQTSIASRGCRIIRMAIGPETGWTSFEKDMFRDAGFSLYSMGPEHMASDVAAISAVAAAKGFNRSLLLATAPGDPDDAGVSAESGSASGRKLGSHASQSVDGLAEGVGREQGGR